MSYAAVRILVDLCTYFLRNFALAILSWTSYFTPFQMVENLLPSAAKR